MNRRHDTAAMPILILLATTALAGCIEPAQSVLPANDTATGADATPDASGPPDAGPDAAEDIGDEPDLRDDDGSDDDTAPTDIAPPDTRYRLTPGRDTRSFFAGQSLHDSFGVKVEVDDGDGFALAPAGVELRFQRQNDDGVSWRDAGPIIETDDEGWAYSDYWEPFASGNDIRFRFIVEAERGEPEASAEVVAIEAKLEGVALGAVHACGRTDTQELLCWGFNGPPSEDAAVDGRPMTHHTWVENPSSPGDLPRVDAPVRVPIPGQRADDVPLPPRAALLSVAVAGHLDDQGRPEGAATCISIGSATREDGPLQSDHAGVWCVGSNIDHRLAHNATAPASDWVRVQAIIDGNRKAMPPASQIVSGGDHFCATVQNGLTREIYCWGNNMHGQLAMAPGGSPATAVKVVLPPPEDGTGALVPLALVAGRTGTCAVVADIAWSTIVSDLLSLDTDVYCWGRGADNQFGVMGREGLMGPLRMPIEHVCEEEKSLPEGAQLRFASGGLGARHACALIELALEDPATGVTTACGMTPGAPRVICSGVALDGRRGIELPSDGTMIVPPIGFAAMAEPPLEHFEMLSVGDDFSCGVTASDNAFCWGYNGEGQLGTFLDEGDASANALKVQFASGTLRVQAVAAGPNYACAATTDDSADIPEAVTLMCWGDNTFGQSGSGCEAGRGTPACEGPAPRPVVFR